jgi:uncharacterized protein YidB (DUF937 family)
MIEQLISQLTGKLGPQAGPLIGMLIQHLQGNGGQVMGNLTQAGLGGAVGSWLGTGPNEAITPEAAGDAVGPDFLREASQKLGMSEDEVRNATAVALPEVVNGASPDGAEDASALGGGLESLVGKLPGGLGGLLGGDLGKMAGGLLGGGGLGNLLGGNDRTD